MAKAIRYSEPADYFPKDIRKKAGIGEFAKADKSGEKKSEPGKAKSATPKKGKK